MRGAARQRCIGQGDLQVRACQRMVPRGTEVPPVSPNPGAPHSHRDWQYTRQWVHQRFRREWPTARPVVSFDPRLTVLGSRCPLRLRAPLSEGSPRSPGTLWGGQMGQGYTWPRGGSEREGRLGHGHVSRGPQSYRHTR